MKEKIAQLFEEAVRALRAAGELPVAGDDANVPVKIEHSRGATRGRRGAHGDYATNIAMVLARTARCEPLALAQKIIAHLPAIDFIARVEVAGPGFINVFVAEAAQWALIDEIRQRGRSYGHSDAKSDADSDNKNDTEQRDATKALPKKVLVEFVSANPTGPLHVGHGRGAACGDALVRILRATGYEVASEYYVNDGGRQMDILALSVYLRYLSFCGEVPPFPDNGYRGEYVTEIARKLYGEFGTRYHQDCTALFATQEDATVNSTTATGRTTSLGTTSSSDDAEDAGVGAGTDAESAMDTLIQRMRELLGAVAYKKIFNAGLNTILDDIRRDLRAFRVEFEHWFHESSLQGCAMQEALASLQEKGHVYEQDGAMWFRSSTFGDTKDRVVRRANGAPTYFASDIAYHFNKVQRGYHYMIDILGADHHGYAARVRGALQAGYGDAQLLQVLFVQLVALYRHGVKASMSTRQGEFVTLRALRDEVGVDAARFFYVMRKTSQQLDFDMELARSQSNDNPVYYVQYAHARICSVFAKWRDNQEAAGDADMFAGADYALLQERCESELLTVLARFPEVVQSAARDCEPHQVANYLRVVAGHFHTWYNQCRFMEAEPALRAARFALSDATRYVLVNGLTLLGVSAPQKM